MNNELSNKVSYRVSSRSYIYMGKKTFVGRVHYYEPWDDNEKHDAIYKRVLFSESTGIHRLYAFDAHRDAHKIATDRLQDSFSHRELKEMFSLDQRLDWPPVLFRAVHSA